jgi:hypothetical protein
MKPRNSICIMLLIFFLAPFNLLALSKKLDHLIYLHDPTNRAAPGRFVYVAGIPRSSVDQIIKDVKHNFELAALYASTFRKPQDRAVFLFFRDREDTGFKERVERYAKHYKLKNYEFKSYNTKQEFIKLLLECKYRGPLNGLFFFVHSYPFALNIGTFGRPEGEPKRVTEEEALALMKIDTKYLYINNLYDFLSDSERKDLLSVITPETKILLAGCRSAVEIFVFKDASLKDVDGSTTMTYLPGNYYKTIKFNSYANRLANLFNSEVSATNSSTHFEISLNGGRTFIRANSQEEPPLGSAIIMIPDHGDFLRTQKLNSKIRLKEFGLWLKPSPIQPYSPEEILSKRFYAMDKASLSYLQDRYMRSKAAYDTSKALFDIDFEFLPEDMKNIYAKELEMRKQILDQLLIKERWNQIYKKISYADIYWFRWESGVNIGKIRGELGLPPIKIDFVHERQATPIYFIGGEQYYENDIYEDFLEIIH